MIYFIESESGHIKVGYCDSNIYDRLCNMKTMNPFKLTLLKVIPGERKEETEILKKFSNFIVRGEWFRADKEIYRFIKEQPDFEDPIKNQWLFNNRFIDILNTYLNRKEFDLEMLCNIAKTSVETLKNVLSGKRRVQKSTADKILRVIENQKI